MVVMVQDTIPVRPPLGRAGNFINFGSELRVGKPQASPDLPGLKGWLRWYLWYVIPGQYSYVSHNRECRCCVWSTVITDRYFSNKIALWRYLSFSSFSSLRLNNVILFYFDFTIKGIELISITYYIKFLRPRTANSFYFDFTKGRMNQTKIRILDGYFFNFLYIWNVKKYENQDVHLWLV